MQLKQKAASQLRDELRVAFRTLSFAGAVRLSGRLEKVATRAINPPKGKIDSICCCARRRGGCAAVKDQN